MKPSRIEMILAAFRHGCLYGSAACFLCGLLSCSGVPTTGSGTGVGNGMIVGQVMYANGTHPKNAAVRLRLQNFLPDTSGKLLTIRTSTVANVATNSDGTFQIDQLDPQQKYTIEVNDGKTKTEATLFKCNLATKDTVILSPRIIEPVVSISGEVVLAGLPRNAYILIKGLERVGRSDSQGRFTITDLPVSECEEDEGENECEYSLRAIVPNADGTTTTIPYELEIERDMNGNVKLPIELEISD